MLHLRDIRRRFDRAASRFHDADFVHAQTRDGILARLDPLLLDARSILDLGSATGATGRMLRQRFRRAQVVALDLTEAMLQRARQRNHSAQIEFIRTEGAAPDLAQKTGPSSQGAEK